MRLYTWPFGVLYQGVVRDMRDHTDHTDTPATEVGADTW
jgi:hypothetical protein